MASGNPATVRRSADWGDATALSIKFNVGDVQAKRATMLPVWLPFSSVVNCVVVVK
jgi:hypothetical protein